MYTFIHVFLTKQQAVLCTKYAHNCGKQTHCLSKAVIYVLVLDWYMTQFETEGVSFPGRTCELFQ